MELGSEFPSSFSVQTEFEEVFEVRVEYGWKPRHCTRCKVVGHLDANCPKSTPPIAKPPNMAPNPGLWVPKPTPVPHSLAPSPTVQALVELPIPTPVSPEPSPKVHVSVEPLVEVAPTKDSVPKNVISSKEATSLVGPNPFEALEDFIEKELVRVGNIGPTVGSARVYDSSDDIVDRELAREGSIGTTMGSSSKKQWSSAYDSSENEAASSPMGWGHKIKLVDELDRKKGKNTRKSGKKKPGKASGTKRGK